MVAVHDQLQLLNFAYRQAHSKTRLPLPSLLPRPGEESQRRKTLNAWFGAVGLPSTKRPAPTS
jgi:hypothetical protein